MDPLSKLRKVAYKQKLTVKDINDMVWDFNWEADLDHGALFERLEDLLMTEVRHNKLIEEVEAIKKFFRSDNGTT